MDEFGLLIKFKSSKSRDGLVTSELSSSPILPYRLAIYINVGIELRTSVFISTTLLMCAVFLSSCITSYNCCGHCQMVCHVGFGVVIVLESCNNHLDHDQ